MRLFAQTADAIAGTTSKLKKIGFLADYIRTLSEDDLRASCIFFTGRPFALTDARTLNVGWSALMNAVQQISGASDADIHDVYLARGDLGEMAERLLSVHSPEGALSPAQVQNKFGELVTISGASNKLPPLLDLFRFLTPSEAKYVVKVITGELRIGLKENTVEEAIAKAFDRSADDVRRANMILGDIGETAVLAKRGEFDELTLAMFRPVKFMLATPADTEDEIFATFSGPFYVEDKYDGIRGQLHVHEGRAALYSRTLDDVGHQFPEIIESAQTVHESLIVDGEVVGFKDDQVLPFAMLQKRLGRKRPPVSLLAEVPVAVMIFDLLSLNGRNLLDEPLIERKKLIEHVTWPAQLRIAPFMLLEERRESASPIGRSRKMELEPFFEQAASRRNEGLMLKDAASLYLPGKRGMSWLKWKKALATLDVVVTGVEFGHGRRRDVLSDYTFAVRQDGRLLNIGKAYSGLTDIEIADMTEFFKQHTIQDFGRFRTVEPSVILEVTFNGIQKSGRHASGYALRFPRIVRIRTDKTVADIDTIETVAKIYARHVGLPDRPES